MTLNIGIIGAGHMGRTHARHWARVPDVRIAAVYDVLPDTGRALADAHDAAVYDTLPALLASNVDVVSVCTPTDTHREITETALAAGKHVFCEKPLALTVADCEAMIQATQNAGKLLGVGQVVRFFPEFANAKRLVDNGAVGNPAAVRTHRGGDFPRPPTNWYANAHQSGGVLLDLLVHDFDWLLWCFGPVKRVYARALTERFASGELPETDYALVTLRHESGVVSHVEGTWADPGGFSTTFEIAGDAGLLTHDSRRAAPLLQTRRTPTEKAGGVTLPSSPVAANDDPYYRQLLSFTQSIRENTPLAVRPEEARDAVAVAVAALESARTSRAVSL